MRVKKGIMSKISKVHLGRVYCHKKLVIIVSVWKIEKYLELRKFKCILGEDK